jgi:exocyst complex protein 7
LECSKLTWLAILDSFDTRLAKLEKSILPLYTATQILGRRRNSELFNQPRLQEGLEAYMVPDIDKTLERMEDLANTRQDLAVDESLILRGSVTRILISLSFVDIYGIA